MNKVSVSNAIFEAVANILISMILTLMLVTMLIINNVDVIEHSRIIITCGLIINFIQLIIVRLFFQIFKK